MSFGYLSQRGLASKTLSPAFISPEYLFRNNEQGAWYDPSDMSTLFQDQFGTTPVTAVEQPVSLMLDKSKGLVLGSELVTNGGPFVNTTGWTTSDATISVQSLKLRLTTTNTFGRAGFTLSTTIGKWYKVTANVTRVSGTGTLYVSASTAFPGSGATRIADSFAQNSANNQTFYFLASTATVYLLILSSDNSSVSDWDNISVKELAGNHAYTPSTATASRPVLSARVNLLTKTEEFNDAAWTKNDTTVTANAITAPDNTLTADLLTQGVGLSSVTQAITATTNTPLTASCYLKRGNHDWVRLTVFDFGTSNGFNFWVNLNTGTAGSTTVTGTATVLSSNIVDDGNGWFRVSVSGTLSGTAPSLLTSGVTGNAVFTRATNGTRYIWGADLRVANDGVGIPSYQRVNTSTDYNTVGFPMYLRFDGSDDYMLTNSINFTATDKMTVWSGLRKFTAQGTLSFAAELSATSASNNGVFAVAAPGTATQYAFASKGTTETSANTTLTSYAAPITNVFTGIGNISGDTTTLRLNGVQVANNTSDQGTGNYGNYPLYIGRRGGTTSPFNGRIYSLIVRGAQTSTDDISKIEGWVNTKTLAY